MKPSNAPFVTSDVVSALVRPFFCLFVSLLLFFLYLFFVVFLTSSLIPKFTSWTAFFPSKKGTRRKNRRRRHALTFSLLYTVYYYTFVTQQSTIYLYIWNKSDRKQQQQRVIDRCVWCSKPNKRIDYDRLRPLPGTAWRRRLSTVTVNWLTWLRWLLPDGLSKANATNDDFAFSFFGRLISYPFFLLSVL